MLVTKDWAFIHFPRTGGTWTGQALQAACQTEGVEHLYLPIHAERWRAAVLYHRDIPILGNIRHPCDWYVSKYEYRHWVTHQRVGSPMNNDPVELSKMDFNTYLSYAICGKDWSEMLESKGAQHYQGLNWYDDQGWLTVYLYYWFSLAPWQPDLTPLIRQHRWGHVPTKSTDLARAFNNVTFLRTESLRQDLDTWLDQHGFGSAGRKAARQVPNKNVCERREGRPWQRYFTLGTSGDDDYQLIRNRERLLFELWPQYLE